jgi:hypothetical protein
VLVTGVLVLALLAASLFELQYFLSRRDRGDQ